MSDNVEDIFRLTPVQQGMLFHSLQAPDSVAYLQQVGVRLEGELNTEQFRSAWDSVIARHEVFRCSFVWDDIEHPVQVVRRTVEPQWTEQDWQGRSSDQQERALTEFLERDRQRGIEFGKAPMMRFALFKLSSNQWQLVWTLHHAISDGWSIHLALRQALDAYASLSCGQSPVASDAAGCSFRRFIQWRESRDPKQANEYWQRQLGDFSEPLRLSEDASSSKAEYHRLECDLSENVTEALSNYTRNNRLSMATVVNGAWAFLLSRYCNRRDVVFGITVSGRPVDLPHADQIVGPLLNTLPLRVQVDGDAQIAPWLASIQSQQHDVRELEWSSLLDVQACSGIRRGEALFETIAVVTNYPKHQDDDAHLRIAELHHHERSHYGLAFIVVPGQRLRLILIADADLFDRAQVSKWLDYLAELVEAMVSCDKRTLRDLPSMPRDDRQRIEQSHSRASPACSSTWLEQFDAQLSQRPTDIAVCCGAQTISYAELNQRALRLATRLDQLGVKPGTLVGICMERSVDMIVAAIGIHRAGAAYVPLDPSYPQDRLNSMTEVASLQFVVTSELCQEKVPAGIPQTISICELGDADPADASTLPTPKSTDLAYVIFTSGSTGQPRAVGLSHANLAHSTRARIHYYKEPVGSFLLLSSLSFDSSVAGIFWTLATGGKLCIPVADHGMEPLQLQNVFATERVTHLLCIPSLYRELLNVASAQMTSLSIAIMAGESLPTETVREHFELLPNVRLFNEYGPTEASVWCTVYECRPEITGSRIPIGRAIESMKALIVDDELQTLPMGVAGELIVGGTGTADGGYLGMADVTAERFISMSGNGSADRFFRTGDLARLRNDGELEFLGRNDRQVKIRGYRVELEGIESVASQHPQVGEVVAAAVSSPNVEDAKVDRLLEYLESLGSEVAESLLSQAEASHEPSPASESDFQRNGYDSRKVAKGPRFELVLKAKDSFVKPPRNSQREWLLDQAINEFRDDLNHLDNVARRFVSGHDTEREQYQQDAARAKLTDQQIMEDWQTPLMRVMAEYATASHGDVLEIGFGRGVSATFIQEHGVKSHTIIEVNDHSVNHHFRAWQQRYPDRDIRLIHKLWQDATGDLGKYDGILFHAFPLNEKEFVDYVVESVTFAEHFFPSAAEHLRPGGSFTYLTTEIDSLSRRHQRKLYEWFDELTMRVVPVTVPANTRDQWWADSMVAVKATRRK